MWRFGFVLLLVSSFAVADLKPVEGCKEPELVLVPDDAKVSSEEMLQVQMAVEGYIDSTQTFLSCLLDQEKAMNEAITQAQQKGSIMRYNLAIARMESLVENFNAQLDIYKTLHSD